MDLPVNEVLPEVRRHLARGNTLVLQAPPGAGKTTQVPLALLEEPWLEGRRILMLEPRRLAARAAAQRMAAVLGEAVGASVGYTVRFERRVSGGTRIEVVTEGILTRRLQRDPSLEDVGLVIFDEFHERNLHSDLALALCLDSLEGLREDLRLLVMSATLDGLSVARLLDAPIVASEGRTHPVSIHHVSAGQRVDIARDVCRAVLSASRDTQGDILAFLPGAGEIRRAAQWLMDEPSARDLAVHMLYGDLPFDAQQRALQPDPNGRRKAVLATPIAETSLTIEGVTVVVDSGWTRAPRFDPRSGLTRLETVRVSAASADQRTGRAGRLAPGHCYRLWSESVQRGLPRQRTPEILGADLAPLVLELAAWGVTDPGRLRWLDVPPQAAIAQARELLQALDALDDAGRITPAGSAMAELPMHPRLARMVREAEGRGLVSLACDIAALLSERDIFCTDRRFDPDLTVRVEALTRFRTEGRASARMDGADPSACARAVRIADQYRRIAGCRHEHIGGQAEETGALLAVAYPDRVGMRRGGQQPLYRLSGGRGARVAADSPLANGQMMVAAVLDGGQEEARVLLAAPLSTEQFERVCGTRARWYDVVAWNAQTRNVVCRRERRFGALAIEETPLARPEPQAVQTALLEGVRTVGLDVLGWGREGRQLQARILSLRHWEEDTWPDVSDAALLAGLEDWLAPYLAGMARLEHLKTLSMEVVLANMVGHERIRRLEAEAPSRLTVPSGSRLRLSYQAGEAPVLAVKLQEMFGLAETPRVAGGKGPVTLPLHSPAARPARVPRALRGFGERT